MRQRTSPPESRARAAAGVAAGFAAGLLVSAGLAWVPAGVAVAGALLLAAITFDPSRAGRRGRSRRSIRRRTK